MFRGITALTIDEKGRLAIPTRYRSNLTENGTKSTLIITIDTEERCLLLYPLYEWQLIEKKLQNLPSFNPMARRIQRLLIGHASDVELDSHGRVLIPPLLREYAALTKCIVFIGQGNKFEIWAEMAWQTRRTDWLAEEIATKHDNLPDEMKVLSL